jgi:hypothetical protein
LQEAIDELGEIWLAAPDQIAVTEASSEIDRVLESDATTRGKLASQEQIRD